jgi:hypothetical protein
LALVGFGFLALSRSFLGTGIWSDRSSLRKQLFDVLSERE